VNKIARVSAARCPNLDLTLCELESYRRRGNAGNEALCTTECTAADFVAIEEQSCGPNVTYPTDLWINTDLDDVPYLERVCCKTGETQASLECPEEEPVLPTSTPEEEPIETTTTTPSEALQTPT